MSWTPSICKVQTNFPFHSTPLCSLEFKLNPKSPALVLGYQKLPWERGPPASDTYIRGSGQNKAMGKKKSTFHSESTNHSGSPVQPSPGSGDPGPRWGEKGWGNKEAPAMHTRQRGRPLQSCRAILITS